MPRYSRRSKDRLGTCHPDLIVLFERIVETFDCTVICGHRGEHDQNEAYAKRASKLRWPESKHNKVPSEAVDVGPWPLEWEARDRFVFLGGFVLGVAEEIGIDIRWGGDWNGNRFIRDERLQDLVHFELVKSTPIYVPTAQTAVGSGIAQAASGGTAIIVPAMMGA